MSDHVALSTPDPVLERLSGGNMLEGTLKAVIRGGNPVRDAGRAHPAVSAGIRR